MKVLLCNKFHYRRGGDCVYTFALAELLRRRGHRVLFFSMRHPQNEPCAQEPYFVDFIDYREMNLRKTPQNALRVLLRSIYSQQARARIRRLLRDHRPDLAHLQNIHSYLTPSILLELNASKIPVLWTLHDYKLICPEGTFVSNGRICEACKGRRFHRCLIQRCKKNSWSASFMATLEAYAHVPLRMPCRVFRFIAPSRFLMNKYLEFGWPAERTVFLRNFLPEWPEPQTEGQGYGLYLGSLLPIKGVPTLLQALARVPDLPFHIVGDGPERPALEKLKAELGLERVVFRGFLTGVELAREQAGADFGVVPSECYENCPYSIMELMAMGKPVIASRLGGIPELVSEDETGLLFEPRNAEDLAAKLILLRASPERRRRLGHQARVRAEREFDPDRYAENLLALYAVAAGSQPLATAPTP